MSRVDDDLLAFVQLAAAAGASQTTSSAMISTTAAATTSVTEVEGLLSLDQFEERFRHKRPVKMRGAARHWGAVQAWAKDMGALVGRLEAAMGGGDVAVLVAKDNRHFFKNALCVEERRKLSDIFRSIFGGGGDDDRDRQRLYCRLPLVDQVLDDVDLPNTLVFGPDGGGFKQANCGMWASAAGNITPLHYDLCHGFLVQIVGRKRWTLFSPDDYRLLYPSSSIDPNPLSSQVSIEQWYAGDASQRARFPKVADAEPYHVDLEPGDIMYTPPFWWHHVETVEPSISVLLPWDKRPDEPVHPCAL